jgi:hypothetical protein
MFHKEKQEIKHTKLSLQKTKESLKKSLNKSKNHYNFLQRIEELHCIMHDKPCKTKKPSSERNVSGRQIKTQAQKDAINLPSTNKARREEEKIKGRKEEELLSQVKMLEESKDKLISETNYLKKKLETLSQEKHKLLKQINIHQQTNTAALHPQTYPILQAHQQLFINQTQAAIHSQSGILNRTKSDSFSANTTNTLSKETKELKHYQFKRTSCSASDKHRSDACANELFKKKILQIQDSDFASICSDGHQHNRTPSATSSNLCPSLEEENQIIQIYSKNEAEFIQKIKIKDNEIAQNHQVINQ